MRIFNFKELRKKLKKGLSAIQKSVSTLRKRNDLFMTSIGDSNSLKETQYLLSGKNREHIAQSLREIKEGRTFDGDLNEG